MRHRSRFFTALLAFLTFGGLVFGAGNPVSAATPNQSVAHSTSATTASSAHTLSSAANQVAGSPQTGNWDPTAPIPASMLPSMTGILHPNIAAAELANLSKAQAARPSSATPVHLPPAPATATTGRGLVQQRSTLTTCAPSCFYYTVGSESPAGGATGIAANIDIVKPTIYTSKGDSHSLAEEAVQDTLSSPASGRGTYEFGYTVDPTICGSIAASPCFFAFTWVGTTPKGYNVGWVNAATTGACAVSASLVSPVSLGGTLALASLKQFTMARAGTWPTGAWWVGEDGKWVACLPDATASGWGMNNLTTADYFQIFGELASSHDNSAGGGSVKPCGQIGSGTKGSLTNTVTPSAARFGNTTYIGNSVTPNLYIRGASNTGLVDTDYDTSTVTSRSFYWGGKTTAVAPTC
jgi:hypothetical protein